MSYETGVATSVGDLLVKWFNFLQANGWTADDDFTSSGQSPQYGIIHRQEYKTAASPQRLNDFVNLYMSMQIGTTDSDGDRLLIQPMRGYSGSAGPIGSGVVEGACTHGSNYQTNQSFIDTSFPTSPFESYHFFESDWYAHAVVEYQAGFYRHFGCGSLNKIGKYEGGEYYYGTYWIQAGFGIDDYESSFHSLMFDGTISSGSSRAGRIYAGQLDGQAVPSHIGRQSPDSKWWVFSGTADNGSGVAGANDHDGRDTGGLTFTGMRRNLHWPFHAIGVSPFNGYRPMIPIFVATDNPPSTPDDCYPLGTVPDMRIISMEGNLLAGDEFTVGADTWVAFPFLHKRNAVVADDTEQSGLRGVAYKKVLT